MKTNTTGYPVIDNLLESIAPGSHEECNCHKFIRLHDGNCPVHGFVRKQAEDEGEAHGFSNWRVMYAAPTKPEHQFEARCWIEADSARFGSVRVFDVPDPDESQRAAAEAACVALNSHAALVSFVNYVRDFYQQNFDVVPVAFQTVDSEAESLLESIQQA